jgi:hypothetical protein
MYNEEKIMMNFGELEVEPLEFEYNKKIYKVNHLDEKLEKKYTDVLDKELKGRHLGEGFASNRNTLRIMTNLPENEISNMHQTIAYNICTWIFDEIFKSKKKDSKKSGKSGKASSSLNTAN